MKGSAKRNAWGISIVGHLVLIAIGTLSIPKKDIPNHVKSVSITVELVQKKVQKKVVSKQTVTKNAKPNAQKKAMPTSLPGDRAQPAVSYHGSPVYPKKALNNDWQGTVSVKVTVSKGGRATGVSIVSSSGYDELDDAFIRAIRQQYRFKPKRTMGKDTSGTLILSHTFSLQES